MGIVIPVHPYMAANLNKKDILLFLNTPRFSPYKDFLAPASKPPIDQTPTETSGIFSFYHDTFVLDYISYLDISTYPFDSKDSLFDVDSAVSYAIKTVAAYFIKTSPYPFTKEEQTIASNILGNIRQALQQKYTEYKNSTWVRIEQINLEPFRLAAQHTPKHVKDIFIEKTLQVIFSSAVTAAVMPLCNPFSMKRDYFPIVPHTISIGLYGGGV